MADLNLKVYSQDGTEVSSLSVSENVFGIEPHQQIHVKQQLKQRKDLKLAAVVRNLGDKKELVELELVQHVHLSGLAAEQYLAQQEFKISKSNKTKNNTNLL